MKILAPLCSVYMHTASRVKGSNDCNIDMTRRLLSFSKDAEYFWHINSNFVDLNINKLEKLTFKWVIHKESISCIKMKYGFENLLQAKRLH